ncbi:microfibril-associated glycoprotein 4-like [Pelobates fuscus]|uniref:microfibril-associated glycoprotein 4-like n=1 Tax=Pelobates fuscus TaxID=191477 RepID=UPI002FE43FE5
MEDLILHLLVLVLYNLHVGSGNVPINQQNILACAECCYPYDCCDVYSQGFHSDGVYLIFPGGTYSQPVHVYCDMASAGGPWTVFQKRFNGLVDFYRGWDEYENGFGRADGEYWLGLRNIHQLTQRRPYRLRIQLEDFEKNTRFVTYESFFLSQFAIYPPEQQYKLNVAGFKEGDPLNPAGNSLEPANNMNFSTYDHDGDTISGNCAVIYHGAFWYNGCHNANLNGKYLNGSTSEYAAGMVWSLWKGYYYSLKRSEMKMACISQ